MLLEAGFDAVRTVVLAVRAALVGDTQGAAVYRLAYYAGVWGSLDGLGIGKLGEFVGWLANACPVSSAGISWC